MISIITINLNNKEGLTKTIESVVNQTYFDKIEYIIIDGGSTDGSVDVIKEFADKISYWVSEQDNGIYNAMNKGIKLATGDYFLFLNSGDYLSQNNVIERVFPYLEDGYDMVYGNEWKVKAGSAQYEAKYPDKLSESFFKMTTLPHQSTFIKRELLNDDYDENYKVISDWLFFLKIFRNKATYKHMPFIVSVYNCDGISSIYMKEEKEKYLKKISL